ncbi:MAG: STAS domain-containing protein [Caldilineales bacterium]|nr:STAS domain-containing protein [Caldilineales bacterium]
MSASRFWPRRLSAQIGYILRPWRLLRSYKREDLRFDLTAGATVTAVLLPQAIALALLAGLPPQMGVFGAIMGAAVGALWGSSWHLHSGPTNTHSLLTAAVLTPLFVAGSPEYMAAAGLLAVMIGVFRLIGGLARLGLLANFISDAVIVGFTAGAGALIVIGQLPNLLKIQNVGGANALASLQGILIHAEEIHLLSAALGVAVILLLLGLQRWAKKAPAPLLAMILSGGIVALAGLDAQGVQVVGAIPAALPTLASLPFFDLALIGNLSGGALAIGAIGLVEAVSIARALSAQSGQRLDSNQEFVGQGVANIAAGLFSGFPGSASFNRSAMNYAAGARTPLAAVFSGLILLGVILILGPLVAYVPFAALAGILVVIAFRMVDYGEMARILRSTRGDATIMVATLLATLFLPLQFAVLTGILMALAYYILKTSTPQVLLMVPDADYMHLEHRPDQPNCAQLAVMEIRGDLYFGAVNHVEEAILANAASHPAQLDLLLRLNNVQQIDISGVHMLEAVVRSYRERGGDVFLSKARPAVLALMRSSGFAAFLGEDHLLAGDGAIPYLFYHVLDPVVCIYECPLRVFAECQNLPKPTYEHPISRGPLPPLEAFNLISPRALYQDLKFKPEMLVIDVREPREFAHGHIPQAQNIPLPVFMRELPPLPHNRTIVLVCRTSRRSRRVAQLLQAAGYLHLFILEQGMVGWETAHLLEAVDSFA